MIKVKMLFVKKKTKQIKSISLKKGDLIETVFDTKKNIVKDLDLFKTKSSGIN